MCVTGLGVANRMGIRRKDMVETVMQIAVANNAGLETVGAVFMTLTGCGGVTTGQMVYFARGIDDFYLSKEACRDLGIVDLEFPEVRGRGPVGSRRRRSSSAPPPLEPSKSSPSALRALGGLTGCQVSPVLFMTRHLTMSFPMMMCSVRELVLFMVFLWLKLWSPA